jgi:hypothetical protein
MSEDRTRTYEEGVQDGRIAALETITEQHHERLNDHSSRLKKMERIIWLAFGALFAIQALPEVIAIAHKIAGT